VTGRAGRPPDGAKARDRSMVLLLAGLTLLMPPVGGIFQLDAKIAGVPFTVVYLFVVWAMLILCGWRLARRLGRVGAAGDGGDART